MLHGRRIGTTVLVVPAGRTAVAPSRAAVRRCPCLAAELPCSLHLRAGLGRRDGAPGARGRARGAPAFGGLAHRPWRARRTEAVLLDTAPTAETIERAVDAESADAVPCATTPTRWSWPEALPGRSSNRSSGSAARPGLKGGSRIGRTGVRPIRSRASASVAVVVRHGRRGVVGRERAEGDAVSPCL
ncbi:hypothetical protein [Streptomyces sp. NPDC001415]